MKNIASYDSTGINLNLKKINYIFGSNGTGKTTISELLRKNRSDKVSSCNIVWKKENKNIDLFVYNKHFIDEKICAKVQ